MLQAQASNDTTALTPELLDAQREIETRASKDGYDRYIKQQDSAVSNMGGHASAEAVKLIRGSIPVVSAKISDWIAENDHAGRGRRHAALAVLKRFDPDLLAFLTLNGIFSGITQEQQVVTIQTGIGAQIEAEIVSMDLEETQGRKVALRVKAQVAKNGSYHQRNVGDPLAPITHSFLGAVTYLNKRSHAPFMRRQADAKFVPLANWDPDWRCAVLRPYKDFLVALDVRKGAVEYPQMIKWSDIALYGDAPPSWDAGSTTNSAGENVLNEMKGRILDGHTLRDTFTRLATTGTEDDAVAALLAGWESNPA